jgi:glycosyltransferase involved in cell wall biosynthesis
MSNRLLTIITINYNNAKGLAKTFESVKSQTWAAFEYIVIDGGSTDESKQLIDGNEQIHYHVSEKDKGVYNAMNKGIKAATGDYVIFMNSGDFFYNDSVLEKAAPYFDNSTGIVYGNSVFINDAGYREEKRSPQKLTFGFFFTNGLNHQATFIKRSLFLKHFLYNEDFKMYADWAFFVYVLCAKNEPYRYINEFICYYDYAGFSASAQTRALYEQERTNTLETYFPLFTDDYAAMEKFKTKRMQQVLHIQQYPFAWRIFKWIISLFSLLLPKKKSG